MYSYGRTNSFARRAERGLKSANTVLSSPLPFPPDKPRLAYAGPLLCACAVLVHLAFGIWHLAFGMRIRMPDMCADQLGLGTSGGLFCLSTTLSREVNPSCRDKTCTE